MKFLISIQLLFGIIMGSALAQPSTKIDLDPYRWKNRLILIFAPSETDATYQKVKNQTKIFEDEWVDRDIVIFHLFEKGKSFVEGSWLEQESVDSLRKNYGIQSGKLTSVLIGKDGGEKFRQQDRIDSKHILSLIDSMPMRQMEMQHWKKD